MVKQSEMAAKQYRTKQWRCASALIAIVLSSSGCGPKVSSPRAEIAPPGQKRNLLGTGEILYSPVQPSAATFTEPPLKNTQQVKLAIPYYYYGQLEFFQGNDLATVALPSIYFLTEQISGSTRTPGPPPVFKPGQMVRKIKQDTYTIVSPGNQNDGHELKLGESQVTNDLRVALKIADKAVKDASKQGQPPDARANVDQAKAVLSAVRQAQLLATAVPPTHKKLKAILSQFERERNIEVQLEDPLDEERLREIKTEEGTPPRIALLGDFEVAELKKKDLLMPIDSVSVGDQLPYAKNIDKVYFEFVRHNHTEGSERFLLPYHWSLMGIAYDADLFNGDDRKSWGSLFEPQLATFTAGQVTMVNERRMLIKTASVYLAGELEGAEKLLHVAVDNLTASRADPIEIKDLQKAERQLQIYQGKRTENATLGNLMEVVDSLSAFLKKEGEEGTAPRPAEEVSKAKADNKKSEELKKPPSNEAQDGARSQYKISERDDLDKALKKLHARLRMILDDSTAKDGASDAFAEADSLVDLSAAPKDATKEQRALSCAWSALRKSLNLGKDNGFSDSTSIGDAGTELLNKYFGGEMGLSSNRNAVVRGALELLFGYCQYLPDASVLMDNYEASMKGDMLSKHSLRNLVEVGAAINLLRRQAFAFRGQDRLYDDNAILALQGGGVAMAMVRGPRAVELILDSSNLQSKRPIRFLLPLEGSTGSLYHLVLLKSKNLGADEKRAAYEVLNYLLRPAVAGAVSNLFRYATTEGDARPFVERTLLNGPSYALPEDGSLYLVDLNSEKLGIYSAAGQFVHDEWQRLKNTNDEPKPQFPLGTSCNTDLSDVLLMSRRLEVR